jgi:hypothetical protein
MGWTSDQQMGFAYTLTLQIKWIRIIVKEGWLIIFIIIINIIVIMVCKNVTAEETTWLLSCAVNEKLTFFNMCKIYMLGLTIAQAVSRWLPIAVARVQNWV